MKDILLDERAFNEKELEHLEKAYFNKRLPELRFNPKQPKKSWSDKIMDWVVWGN